MPDIAMQLKVTHTFDTQLFSQVSPFSTFQRRRKNSLSSQSDGSSKKECIELKVVMDICHGENSLYDDRTAHKCDQADYTSYQASNLRRHLKTHSGEKSNKCNQCDSVFSR